MLNQFLAVEAEINGVATRGASPRQGEEISIPQLPTVGS
jgi:hypothetical protein